MVLPLKASLGQLSAAQSKIDEVSKNPMEVLLIAPDDKRALRDSRRESLLRALFCFWANAGRKLPFTTDILTSERRGPLIDFVNAVVACVTDPPSTLKSETIVAEIRRFPPELVVVSRVLGQRLGAVALLKHKLRESEVTYAELAKRLKKHGFKKETEASITNRFRLENFTASFFLACFAALELDGVSLDEFGSFLASEDASS